MKRTFASGLSSPLNLKTLLFWVAPVVLAMAAAPSSASASFDNTKGDFILGFRQVGSTTSILVDIGPITDFTSGRTFDLGALGSLLSSTYGSAWATNPDVHFSVAATTRPEDGTATVNYVTSPEYPADGVGAKIWPKLTQTNSFILQNKIINCGEDFNIFSAQTGTTAVLEPSTSPDAYQNFMPGGTTDAGHAGQGNIGWGFFNPTPEGTFKNGAAGVILHLIQITPGSGSGTDLGRFVLSADGNTLTFSIPTPSHPAFFNGEVSVGNGVYYLAFANGNSFSYYSYLSDPHYIYHFDLGFEYVFDAADGKNGVYLYDFASNTFFYSSPVFPFPYLYDFSLNSVLYYYPDPANPGRYNTNGFRFFYEFNTGQIITK